MDTTTSGGLETVAAEKSEIQARDTQDQELPLQSRSTDNGLQDDSTSAQKRSAEDDLEYDSNGSDDDKHSPEVEIITGLGDEPLSKNKMRKLKRRKLWEDKREDRKLKRKEKRLVKQERKRLEKEAEIELAAKEGREPVIEKKERDRDPRKQTPVPVSIILDCQFEEYMDDKELVSLASQITRSYSDTRKARFPAHLCISSWGGKLEERFMTVLEKHHESWKGVKFERADFVQAAANAQNIMKGDKGGTITDLLQLRSDDDALSFVPGDPASKPKRGPAPVLEPESEGVERSIVYLTADSPYTLDRLEPNVSYVVGGIIDRNRHKGLCYKFAKERNVRTAKLPIGQYMVLHDRHVLATNHVVEIMLRWLELGDWGAAFLQVIPTRKGGTLKEDDASSNADLAKEIESTNRESEDNIS